MLVRAFEVEIGWEAGLIGMRPQMLFTAERPAHDGLMRRAGVEPDVDGIAELAVARFVDAEILASCVEPCFDAACAILAAASSISAGVSGCSSSVSLSTNKGRGTPH